MPRKYQTFNLIRGRENPVSNRRTDIRSFRVALVLKRTTTYMFLGLHNQKDEILFFSVQARSIFFGDREKRRQRYWR